MRVRFLAFAVAVLLLPMVASHDAHGETAAGVSPNARCVRGTVPAVIGGKRVCLKEGQRCSANQEAGYRRYGFTCARRGRLARRFVTQLGRSVYTSLSDDQPIDTRTVVLSAQIALAKPDVAFLEADGGFAPAEPGSAATMYIAVDGSRVSNLSTIDWRGSGDPVRHTFNAISAVSLASGRHTIELVGVPLSGSFVVAASSNLSVVVHPAEAVAAAQLAAQAGPINYTTFGLRGPDLPHARLLARPIDGRRPTVALGSATARRDAHDGDAMLGIYLNGNHPGITSSLWTVNDICTCAELEAPMFTHALLTGGPRSSTVSFDATEYPWTFPGPPRENPAIFTVQPTATLVVLNGGMAIVGSAPSLLDFFPDLLGTVTDGWCIGSNSDWPGCPPTGSDVVLAQATIRVPAGHPGVVMFLAKTRVQADESDPGGDARLWITVDGKQRGSVGVQQLAAPSSVSGRTVTASYLAAGDARLKPGRHTIRVYGRAEGSFIHLVYFRDLPLLWFD
jgi:hypothetical protein